MVSPSQSIGIKAVASADIDFVGLSDVQVANLLLDLARGAGVASPHLGRRDMLQAMFETLRLLEPAVLTIMLQAIEALTTYPSLLQPLQVLKLFQLAGNFVMKLQLLQSPYSCLIQHR